MKNLVTLAGSLVAANATADVIKDLLLGRPWTCRTRSWTTS